MSQLLPDLLDATEEWMRQFLVLSDAGMTIVVVWVAHTWVYESFETTPRLLIRSPVRESGKTRLLEILRALSRDPLLASSVSPAALFRSTDAGHPTILLDEVDNFLSAADRSDRADIIGLINDGFWVNGAAIRCVGDSNNVRRFSTFAPLAMAGLSKAKVPDTTLSRCFIVDMQRKRSDEPVSRYRLRGQSERSAELRERLEAWAAIAKPALSAAYPDLPDELGDRQQDILEPLAAIADMAAGDWPQKVRKAAVKLHQVAAGRTVDEHTLAEQLLADLRTVFGSADKLPTATLIERLWKLDEAPWDEMPHTGKPLDARVLARLLKPWGVRPRTIKMGTSTLKGYHASDFHDAWLRYLDPSPVTLPSPDPDPSRPPTVTDVTNVTLPQNGPEPANMVADASVTLPSPAPDNGQGDGVTVVTPPPGGASGGYRCVDCGEPATASDYDGSERCGRCVSWAGAS